MPAPFGLTLAGFNAQSLLEILEDMRQRVLDAIALTLDVSDRSLEGQLIGIVSERLSLLWEILEQVVAAIDIDKAVDAQLDALCLLTGTSREGAAASTATLTLTGAAATVVPAGSGARVPLLTRFDTDDDGTLVALAAWTVTTAYAVGNRVTNAGNAYEATVAGTSAGAGGPTTTSYAIVDGTVTWRFLGIGVAAVDVFATATETGPNVANSGTITEIVTPVGGWTGVSNVLAADIGHNQMTDAELRLLRDIELSQPGTSTQDAIRAALLEVPSVSAATVFVNNTDATFDGMPPHSVEALVQGGTNQNIFDALLANVAAGIQTFGTTSGIAVDSSGVDQPMKFTRPTEIAIKVRIDLIKDPDEFPSDGVDQVKAAVVAFGNLQQTGKNAVASSIGAQAFEVAGVLDVTLTYIIIAPGVPVASTTIPIALRELATFITANITVNVSDGVP